MTELSDTSNEIIERAMKRLRQGLMTESADIARDAHRLLREAAPRSTPFVIANLSSIDLSDSARGEVVRLAVGLAALLHDIDERLAEEYLDAALARPVHPAIRAGFNSIRQFTKKDYRVSNFLGIEIFEHRTLPLSAANSASHFIRSWLAIAPSKDLQGIARIYLSRHDENVDYSGTYLPGLSVINIVWEEGASSSRISRFLLQRTLYHEVGHHALRHRLGWQDPQQEEEAEKYALRIMARAYPSLRLVANIGRWLRGKPRLER